MTTNPKPQSVAELFHWRVGQSKAREAFRFPAASGWQSLTWKQTGDRVRDIACGLLSLGLQPEQRVAILSSTRLEWILADFGILCAGGATSTIYPSSTAAETAFIIQDSNTRFVFAENQTQVTKVLSERTSLPNLERVIILEGQATNSHDGFVITLSELESKGRDFDRQNPNRYDTILKVLKPQHLATLIYTSGTTGRPKGVELTHDCWLFEAHAMAAINVLREDDHQYLWLPLSHSFGKVLLMGQLQVGFMTSVDGRVEKLVSNLQETRPTFMAAAPRIFEKVYNKVVTTAQQGGALKYNIFRWALDIGRQVSALKQRGQKPSGKLALSFVVADRLVFSKLRARFGGRLRFFISGSAALSRDIAEFFHAAGIVIYEGYGLTESSAASSVSRPDSFRFGTVGLPLPGVEVKFADDGEVLLRGRGIMRGYHNLPDETAAALTKDGWLCTGDIGELDEVGRLKITDRKKDLIKTSGGKYVAPQMLESKLKALCPYLSQVVVHGNDRNFCSALVTLDADSMALWAKERALTDASPETIAKHPEVVALVESAIDQLNKQVAKHESIKQFAILPNDFTVEAGELTPSLKVKRKTVEQKHKAVLDAFYAGSVHHV